VRHSCIMQRGLMHAWPFQNRAIRVQRRLDAGLSYLPQRLLCAKLEARVTFRVGPELPDHEKRGFPRSIVADRVYVGDKDTVRFRRIRWLDNGRHTKILPNSYCRG
jgi:hypothetical protein